MLLLLLYHGPVSSESIDNLFLSSPHSFNVTRGDNQNYCRYDQLCFSLNIQLLRFIHFLCIRSGPHEAIFNTEHNYSLSTVTGLGFWFTCCSTCRLFNLRWWIIPRCTRANDFSKKTDDVDGTFWRWFLRVRLDPQNRTFSPVEFSLNWTNYWSHCPVKYGEHSRATIIDARVQVVTVFCSESDYDSFFFLALLRCPTTDQRRLF